MNALMVSLKNIFLLVFLAGFQIVYGQTKEEQILTIRAQYNEINADSSYQVRAVAGNDIGVQSCGGAMIEGFYKADELKRADFFIAKSNGIYFTEYYYWDNELFFAFEVEKQFYYDVQNDTWDYDSIVKLYEGRYYFANDGLIDAKHKGEPFNQEVLVDSIVGATHQDLAITYEEHLRHAKVKSKAYDIMLSDLLDHSVTEILVNEIDPYDSTIIYLDAREYDEYAVSHIDGAIWVGYDDFDMSRLDSIAKSDHIIVYCSVGYRSEKVSEKLLNANYENVSNMYGSIFEWVNQGKPVYDMNGKVTPNVHAFDKEWGRWLKQGTKVYD